MYSTLETKRVTEGVAEGVTKRVTEGVAKGVTKGVAEGLTKGVTGCRRGCNQLFVK